MKKAAVLFVAAFIMFAGATELLALPKFASRVGVKCQACHMDPTGGGMRNTFGSTYGREELPVKTYKNVVDTADDGKGYSVKRRYHEHRRFLHRHHAESFVRRRFSHTLFLRGQQ